ncbi:hypothetical protein BZA70DRAFT_116029 [Myxozyma melibiosi]|uniref:Uncharacterized protein n=1 Tax=Myxozyma melibiosi TaxID=54550 RepID=A0ABR1FAG0_9ASCO
MPPGERAIKALSNVLRRVTETGRQAIREALEEGWPPGNNGGGGGGLFGRRRELVPVRVPVPVNNRPRFPQAPSGSSSRWYSTSSRHWFSSDSFTRQALNQQARGYTNSSRAYASPARFNSVSARLSNIKHSTTFAHPIYRPRIGGTLHRSPMGYSLPGFRARGSARYFSYNVRPMADVISNLSAGFCASGIGASKLAGSIEKMGPSYVHQKKLNVFVTENNTVRVTFADAPRKFEDSSVYFGSAQNADGEKTVSGATRQVACISFDVTPTYESGTVGTLTQESAYVIFPKWQQDYQDNMSAIVRDIQKLSQLGELSFRVQHCDNGQQFLRVYLGDRSRDEVELICQELHLSRAIIVDVDITEVDAVMLATAGTALSDSTVPVVSAPVQDTNSDYADNNSLLSSPFSSQYLSNPGAVSVASDATYLQLMPSFYGSEGSDYSDVPSDSFAPWADNGRVLPPV